jgi:hypothetical protein
VVSFRRECHRFGAEVILAMHLTMADILTVAALIVQGILGLHMS